VSEATSTVESKQPVLKVENVSKSFGKVQALNKVSLEIYEGDVLALLGDNGAGKSTLTKIISGNYTKDSGTIYLQGKPINFSSPAEARKAGIETVYQQSPVCEHASVTQNFFIGREKCFGIPGFNILKKVDMRRETRDVMDSIGINVPSVREEMRLLSGGQRQAIILGRFFHWGGILALLDEPFAALGVGESRKAIGLVKQMSQEMKLPIVLITHNVEYAFEVSNRYAVLRQGDLVGTGNIADVTVDQVVGMITGAIHSKDLNNEPADELEIYEQEPEQGGDKQN